MIDEAWNEYRGWAKRARDLQASTNRWNLYALVCAALAAACGAAATQWPSDTLLAKILSFAAAATAALTPILGREILSVGNESKWIAARAIAEAIKSECFRFAAKVDDYAGADALDRFIAKREALTQTAAEAKITPADDPIPAAGDKRKPSVPLDPEWYLDNRVTDQIKFYANGQHRHEQAISRLRLVSFGAAVVAALFGVAGSMGYGSFAPWIGALVTTATAIAAFGLLDRRQFLAVTYSAMGTSLARIKERFEAGTLDLKQLVAVVEDLLASEHAAWTKRMVQTIPSRPTAAPQDQNKPQRQDKKDPAETPPAGG